MKKNTRKLMIFGLTSAMLLTGCKSTKTSSSKEDNISQDKATVVSQTETKTFEPGEHIIYYKDWIYDNYVYSKEQGWVDIGLEIPTVPEGYRFVDTLSVSSSVLFLFVNEVPVEVTQVYDSNTRTYGYFEPGVPVKKLTID